MTFLLYFTAIVLSGIAAYYSVIGLIAIFSAAVLPVAIMGGSLEAAKLVVASWLYRYWRVIPLLMRGYFVAALLILMLITSMGIFGFLSKAHNDQNLVSGDVQAQISMFDERIKTERENISAAKATLAQLDAQVNETLNRTKNAENNFAVNRSITIRRQQAKERASLQKEIEKSNTNIRKLNEERAPIAAEVRKVEAEVGPLKYIAALIYDDSADSNTLERAVRWLIILLIVVFDPLAVLMLIAANLTQIKVQELKNNQLTEEVNHNQPVSNEELTDTDNNVKTAETVEKIIEEPQINVVNNAQYKLIPDEYIMPVSAHTEEPKYEEDNGLLTEKQIEQIKDTVKESKKKVRQQKKVKSKPIEQNKEDKSIKQQGFIPQPVKVEEQIQTMVDNDDQHGLEQAYKKIVKELTKKNRVKSTHWGPIKNTKNG